MSPPHKNDGSQRQTKGPNQRGRVYSRRYPSPSYIHSVFVVNNRIIIVLRNNSEPLMQQIHVELFYMQHMLAVVNGLERRMIVLQWIRNFRRTLEMFIRATGAGVKKD